MTEPAWLVHAVDQRLAQMEQAIGKLPNLVGVNVMMTTLTEPDEGSDELALKRWERTCDRCNRYCGNHLDFYTGQVTRELANYPGIQVIVTFGVCGRCHARFPLG